MEQRYIVTVKSAMKPEEEILKMMKEKKMVEDIANVVGLFLAGIFAIWLYKVMF